jgi:hypothetical protein
VATPAGNRRNRQNQASSYQPLTAARPGRGFGGFDSFDGGIIRVRTPKADVGEIAWPLKDVDEVGHAYASLEGGRRTYVALEIALHYPRFELKREGSRSGVMIPVERAEHVAKMLENCVEHIHQAVREHKAWTEVEMRPC